MTKDPKYTKHFDDCPDPTTLGEAYDAIVKENEELLALLRHETREDGNMVDFARVTYELAIRNRYFTDLIIKNVEDIQAATQEKARAVSQAEVMEALTGTPNPDSPWGYN